MKHAIIFANPRSRSFTASVAQAYAAVVTALGHEVIIRDLYSMDFDPCLKSSEQPFAENFSPGADVVAERTLLRDCEVFALVYPLRLNSPPAILKGYLERVFGFGFAYGSEGRSYNPLLGGRKLISFTSSGAPEAWLSQTGALNAIQTLFDRYFAELCGMTALGHFHAGNVTPGASEYFIRARLDDVAATVGRIFGSQVCH